MKQLYLILVFIGLGCYAQTPVLSIYDDEYGAVNGAYYMDNHNDLEKYSGTWKYTNGTSSLTVTIQKKTMEKYTNVDATHYYFEDIIIGEYQYIENGVIKINTLPKLALPMAGYEHSIAGNTLYGGTSGNRKLRAGFWQDDREIPCMEQAMFMERVDSTGIQKLKINFKMTDGPCEDINEPLQYTGYTLPFGQYILIKQ